MVSKTRTVYLACVYRVHELLSVENGSVDGGTPEISAEYRQFWLFVRFQETDESRDTSAGLAVSLGYAVTVVKMDDLELSLCLRLSFNLCALFLTTLHTVYRLINDTKTEVEYYIIIKYMQATQRLCIRVKVDI